jgi:hypothetical protein
MATVKNNQQLHDEHRLLDFLDRDIDDLLRSVSRIFQLDVTTDGRSQAQQLYRELQTVKHRLENMGLGE